MITNFNKWFHCFVEWADDSGVVALSVIPWSEFFMDKITGTNFTKFVPWWKIHIGE